MQDIDFFETEAVGDLTSRLGPDCQHLSNIIGNDISQCSTGFHSYEPFSSFPKCTFNLESNYCSFRGSGALIKLLILSWPLALSAIVICFVLSAIFLVHGQ